MDILGAAGKKDIIEHVFLWEAAVPQTALSNDANKDTTIRRNGHFVNAYNAANKITVLYSDKDSVLGFDYYWLDKKGVEPAFTELEAEESEINQYMDLINNESYLKMIAGKTLTEEDNQYIQSLQQKHDELYAKLERKYKVRPALGYKGPDDETIKQLGDKLISANCGDCIDSHSAMKNPTEKVMKRAYEYWIMNKKRGIKQLGLLDSTLGDD
jgi:hypothetical protein